MRTCLTLCLIALTGCLPPWDDAWVDNPNGRQVVRITETVQSDTTWTSDNLYVLASDTLVYVEGTSVLSIEAGTEVRGEPGSALIVSRDATIVARGEPDAPIVFTSAQPVGTRRPGDWGGVVLLGNAPLNKSAPRQIEGIAGDEPRAQYGGVDVFDDCGQLEYARIEFGGFELTAGEDGNELNGLTLGACGVNSFIRNVQVHRGLDDGIEVFGGTVDLKNVVISGAGDDSLDWDEGWNGRVQFAMIQQLPVHPDPAVDNNGDEGIEADGALVNDPEDKDEDNDLVAEPFSAPTLSNVTILGSGDSETSQNGMHLKEGTAAVMVNFLVANQTGHGVDVENVQTAQWAEPDPKGKLPVVLELRDSIFYSVGTGTDWAPDSAEDDDADGGFDEVDWLMSSNNRFDQDPGLREYDLAGEWVADPRPFWVPSAGSIAATGREVPRDGPVGSEFFTRSADYVGAIRPGAEVAWWDGWTAFPLD